MMAEHDSIQLREYVDTRMTSTIEAREREIRDLRELVNEKLGGLRQNLLADMATLRATIDERDKLYNERSATGKTAVDAALKSAETAVNSAFAASEKAIVKSDANAEKWRENANEWRAAMMDRETKFASRIEMDTELKSLRTEIASLSKDRDVAHGGAQQTTDMRAWATAGISAVLLLIALATFALKNREADPEIAVLLQELKKTPAPQVIYVPAPNGTQLPVTPPASLPPR
jgi:hypothetical protein